MVPIRTQQRPSLTGLTVQSLGELVDRRGNLQTLVEDGALPLQADYKFSQNSSQRYVPMPKFFGLFSNKGLTTFLASYFLATEGAGATFFPFAFFPLGCRENGVTENINI
ncbi:hypothetical protein EYF80_021617 [Liparis tanakae]|uniref:Uncharacterized protein n=1 Tax=Liparis tanakae TaxID=230148 RepID=A0A4Z2HT07_9TELE|nr:hypothetical protein EYF80_021617 [Liparis tanakae]